MRSIVGRELHPFLPTRVKISYDTCIRRDHSVVLLNKLAYSNPNIVLANGPPIESATGIQDGNPLGQLLFALAIDDTDRSVKSKLNVWYLDNATLSDDVNTVVTEIISITNSLFKILD